MSLLQPIQDIWQHQELLSQLVKREIKARYKQSILGYAWVILVPVFNLAVLTIVFSFFFRIDTGMPYPLFLFAGLVPWTLTVNAVSSATGSLIANSSLITKIKLPQEIFPISTILVKLVDFVLSMAILFFLIVIYRAPVHATLLFVPFIFAIQLTLITGISLFLSAANVYYRDIENILGVLLTAWMYLTPVIYPPEFIPERYMPIFNLNPMMGIINAYRNTILHGVLPPARSFGYAVVISLLFLIGGYMFFKRRAKYFADVI